MDQQEFKEEIFNNKQVIKDNVSKVYNSKKLAKMFLAVFGKIDYLTFCKLPTNEQHELVEKVFGSPELVFGKIIRNEIEKAYKIAGKRKKSKEKEKW